MVEYHQFHMVLPNTKKEGKWRESISKTKRHVNILKDSAKIKMAFQYQNQPRAVEHTG